MGDEVRDISDEIPFEIPDSWEWIRPTDIGYFSSGKTPKADELAKNGIVPYFKVAEMNVPGNELYLHLTENFLIAPERFKLFPRNTIAYPKNGGAVFTNKKRILVKDSLVDLNTGTYTPFSLIDSKFFYYLFSTVDFRKYYKGTALPTVDTDAVQKIVWGLPPLDEQKRIVATIETVMPFIDKYAVKEKQLALLNTSFPQNLKKSILQMAVQGKLIPQDPTEEPADVLIERIRAEKHRLIKEGKIKKDKQESVIFRRDNSHYELVDGVERCIDEELPFEIPENWQWASLGALVQINPRNVLPDNMKVGFVPMALIRDGFSNQHLYEVKKWAEVKNGFTHFADGDVVIAKITPCFQNRKSVLIAGLPNGYGAGTTELHVLRDNTNLLYMPYLLLLCKTHDFITSGVKTFTGTAGQQRVGRDFISNYFIPLPPFDEQHRIVKKVQELFSICEQL